MNIRQAAICALAICGLAYPAWGEPTTPESDRAAKAHADASAKPGTAAHSRAFRRALSGESAPATAARVETPSTKGDIDADPRYLENQIKLHEKFAQKIFGGRLVDPGEFPDTVAVLGEGGICTGTLISEDVVLTAAHCVCGGVANRVVFGDRYDAPKSINVARAISRIPCPGRDLTLDELRSGDQGLLFLERKAEDDPEKLRKLIRRMATTDQIAASTSGRAVGFGKTENAGAGRKFKVDIPFASNNCAGRVVTPEGTEPDRDYYGCAPNGELVAGIPRLGKDTCNGDSGGPLFVEVAGGGLALAGTTSRAVSREGLASCGDGGIYVRVDGASLDWIRKQGVLVAGGDAPIPPQGGRRDLAGIAAALATANAALSLAALGTPTSGENRVVGDARIVDLGSTRLVDVQVGAGRARIPVANPEAIPLAATNQRGELTFAPRANNTVEVVNFKPAYVSAAQASAAKLTDARYAPLKTELARLSEMTQSAFDQLPATSKRRMNEHEVITAYLATDVGETAQRQALSKIYVSLLTGRNPKAIYGRDDRFLPLNYQRIYENSRGGIAIYDRNERQYICSGVLIGGDWALTAAHCLGGQPLSEYEVVFNYERDLENKRLDVDRYPLVAVERNGMDANLDYALLKLGPNTANASAGAKWRAQCLSAVRQRRDSPLYVVGHPEGDPRLIADNGFVKFPFEITEVEFAKLSMLVDAELEGDPDQARLADQFRRSYRKTTTATGVMYEHYSVRWHGYPVIGAEIDTFHGNSGSPVYSRNDHSIVGILIEGEPDVKKPWTPGWRRHEAVLSIKKIMTDLDRALPSWRQTVRPCITQYSMN